MASGTSGTVLRQIQTLLDAGTAAGLSDGELIARFVDGRDGPATVASVAFAALVERHGPMVLKVCRDGLRDGHDAEDAFQATFLVLARRAGSIRRRESVGPWLYGVALRVAGGARAAAARRRRHERRGAVMIGKVDRPDDPGRPDEGEGAALHEEVGRLPERHRAAVVLCYLEGLTHDEAASRLGWPVGTVRSRLAWARDRLRARLTRRGLAPTAGLLAAAPPGGWALPCVPPALAEATIRAAIGASAGTVPAAVLLMAGGALRSLTMARWKLIGIELVAAGLVAGAGVGVVAGRQSPAEKGDPGPRPAASGVARPGGREATADSTRVLAARLDDARRSLERQEGLLGRRLVAEGVVAQARGEVQALSAELEARRGDLRDELKLIEDRLGGGSDRGTATAKAPAPRPEGRPAPKEAKRPEASAEPTRVLATRLADAKDVLKFVEALFKQGELNTQEFVQARGEVNALMAGLEARRDDLRDELDRLRAQLAIRKADHAGAVILVDQAKGLLNRQEATARKGLVGEYPVAQAVNDRDFRKTQADLKAAEVQEVVVRMSQVARRLGEVESLIQNPPVPAPSVPALSSGLAIPGPAPTTPAPPAPR